MSIQVSRPVSGSGHLKRRKVLRVKWSVDSGCSLNFTEESSTLAVAALAPILPPVPSAFPSSLGVFNLYLKYFMLFCFKPCSYPSLGPCSLYSNYLFTCFHPYLNGNPLRAGFIVYSFFFFLKIGPELTSVASLFFSPPSSPQSPPVHSCIF